VIACQPATVGCRPLRLLIRVISHRRSPFSAVSASGRQRWSELRTFPAAYQATRCVSAPHPPMRSQRPPDFVVLSLPSGLASTLGARPPGARGPCGRSLRRLRYRSWRYGRRSTGSEASCNSPALMEALCEESRLWLLPEWEEASVVRPVWWLPRLFPTAGLLPLLPFLQQGV